MDHNKLMSRKFLHVLVGITILALALSACVQRPAGENNLEIFSWWTSGNEAAGLDRLVNLYQQENPGVRVINATTAGGEESIAKQVMVERMLGGDPPDSFQVQIGAELINNWVVAGKMENLDDLYQSEGWDTLFPKDLLSLVTYQDHYFAVPVDIHRANLMWYNPQIMETLSITTVPQTYDDWIGMADKCKAAGISALALGDAGGPAASLNLFESILIGNLGPAGYQGLWSGATPWSDAKVTNSLETLKNMLSYVNADHASLSWDQANQLVIDGKACTTFMGDWIDGDNQAKKFSASGWAPAPGNNGIYDTLADSFALPKGAANPENSKSWLSLVGSKAAQEAFNPLEGGICPRSDCDPKLFGPYLQWAGQEWSKDAIVPSLAYGVAASPAWTAAIGEAINSFVTSQDVATTQAALVKACVDAKICKGA